MSYSDTSVQEINACMQEAWNAFHVYRKKSLKERAALMRAIAKELESCGDHLIAVAMRETNLPEARLRGERGRTIFQLNSYADACERGDWLEARIDTAVPDKVPPKPDIRKMLVPLGPVVVYGASNFPFAYSTAGGDTACALAAGCPVIVKAHPAHEHTSEIVADAIHKAVAYLNLPKGVFQHVYGKSIEVGKTLIQHPHTKAVGFTGSYGAGMQLFKWANERKEPIPVFAEMGSVNPVFLLPEKLAASATDIANMYAGSITLGVGQFCTNPGLIIGIESEALTTFTHDLGKAIQKIQPAPMLHAGIVSAYKEKKGNALLQDDVHLVAESETAVKENEALPTVATASAQAFLNNPVLHQEVFGPYSLIIRCASKEEMLAVAQHLEGQLTATLMATENDMLQNDELVEAVKNICGRFILNSVPTGVEVCLSMQHGGPFPATTDSRFTSVGADGIKRFARPIAFQNWSNSLLPDELKNENPLGIIRAVNNIPTASVL
ncbi:NADP-dependent aldehyde dehydrogenase [Lacibacter cauensis]|uniref:NADP-dependent aldehyde dehydrogenase n=1 Tax=Lacibacter cauensis TaxID=510947 RepID=A0A562SS42_9BACT|nr:aldehyde dehydrogenase (NADP(+)) [Lacibacter cauensis]TWI83834.1 NADP-dependent aldehyde dehydrogenase [Lacibacter cauensis]